MRKILFYFLSVWNSLLEDKKYLLSLGMPREPLCLIGGSAKGGGGGRERRGIIILSGESAFYPTLVIERQIIYNEGK
jgi:hypothetical protein